MQKAEEPGPVRSASLMVGSRLVNMVIGLLAIPVLIRFLGGPGFAQWAILLALAAGFSLLELGMPPAMVRFLAVPVASGDWLLSRRIFGQMWLVLVITFGTGAIVVVALSGRLGEWLRMEPTPLLSPSGAILLVYAAVAARAILNSGSVALFAARRFEAASMVSLLQPLCSNIAAMLVAWQTSRLDLTLMAYWLAQLGVLGATFHLTRHMCLPSWRGEAGGIDIRQLAHYGASSQMEGWAQFVNFQFDKFIVAGMAGLWGVAPYEVANRAVAALRSIPASGAETFLPTAVKRQTDPEQAWHWYEFSVRISALGVCVFILAPLAVAPAFLYAWTGEMGYVGRWAFVALSFGAMASVLALPAATLAQAAAHPEFQARAALVSIAFNIPASLFLVSKWGLVGASIGTGFAMISGAAVMTFMIHRHMGRSVRKTLLKLAVFWPLAVVCLGWGIVTYVGFENWFAQLAPANRFSRALRIYPGLIAGAVYVVCVCSMAWIGLRCGLISAAERTAAASFFRFALRWARGAPSS